MVLITGMMFLLALAFVSPINQMVSKARNTTSEFGGMDCNNASISDYDKNACLSTDLSLPIFIGIVIFIGGAAITVKYVLS